jgi:hypothetical protein
VEEHILERRLHVDHASEGHTVGRLRSTSAEGGVRDAASVVLMAVG